jgi:hypothetical protein
MRRATLVIVSVAICLLAATAARADVPQLINYQGILLDASGNPVTSTGSILFAIWDNPTSGDSLWSESQSVTPDTLGRFNVLLGTSSPIPDSAFDGDAYLSIKIGFDPEMSPRQPLVSVPFAYRAHQSDTADVSLEAAPSSVDSAAIIDGTIQLDDIGQNSAGTDQIIKWNGSAWTIADDEAGGGASGWTDAGTTVRLNTSTDSVGIGTSIPDAKLSVDGDISASGKATIGTGHTNDGTAGFVAGDANTASGDYTTIGGGTANAIDASESSAIGGGDGNFIEYGEQSTIGGGFGSDITSSKWGTIGGGVGNLIDSCFWATVSGGFFNKIYQNNHGGAIGGGSFNRIGTPGPLKSFAADDSILAAAIAGGRNNEVTSNFGAIAGGRDNSVIGNYGTVAGGRGNEAAGEASLAAGSGAHAVHNGSFVWADAADTMSSTGDNQFLVKASGGVGIGTDSPTEQLEVNGVIYSSSGGIRFPDNTVQTTAAAGGAPNGWVDNGSVVSLEDDLDSVGIGTTTPDAILTVAGNTHVTGDLVVDGSITDTGQKTYDSGWFTANLSSTYPLVHNLGTTALSITLYYSPAADGSNAIVQSIGNQAIEPGGTTRLLSPDIYDITTTNMTVGTGDTVLAIGSHSADGGNEVTTGYLRVIALALE